MKINNVINKQVSYWKVLCQLSDHGSEVLWEGGNRAGRVSEEVWRSAGQESKPSPPKVTVIHKPVESKVIHKPQRNYNVPKNIILYESACKWKAWWVKDSVPPCSSSPYEWKAIVYYSLVIIRDVRFGAELFYGWGKIGLQSWHKISLWGLACFKVVRMDVPQTSHFSTTRREKVSRENGATIQRYIVKYVIQY